MIDLFPELQDVRWTWPYACHRDGHIFVQGNSRCIWCGAPYIA